MYSHGIHYAISSYNMTHDVVLVSKSTKMVRCRLHFHSKWLFLWTLRPKPVGWNCDILYCCCTWIFEQSWGILFVTFWVIRLFGHGGCGQLCGSPLVIVVCGMEFGFIANDVKLQVTVLMGDWCVSELMIVNGVCRNYGSNCLMVWLMAEARLTWWIFCKMMAEWIILLCCAYEHDLIVKLDVLH